LTIVIVIFSKCNKADVISSAQWRACSNLGRTGHGSIRKWGWYVEKRYRPRIRTCDKV